MRPDQDVWVNRTAGYDERRRCYVCGKRRMCKQFVVGAPFGVLFDICRDHPDWWPTEGIDYTRVDSGHRSS